MPPFLLVHPHDHPIAVSPPGRKGTQGPGFGHMGTFRTRSMGAPGRCSTDICSENEAPMFWTRLIHL